MRECQRIDRQAIGDAGDEDAVFAPNDHDRAGGDELRARPGAFRRLREMPRAYRTEGEQPLRSCKRRSPRQPPADSRPSGRPGADASIRNGYPAPWPSREKIAVPRRRSQDRYAGPRPEDRSSIPDDRTRKPEIARSRRVRLGPEELRALRLQRRRAQRELRGQMGVGREEPPDVRPRQDEPALGFTVLQGIPTGRGRCLRDAQRELALAFKNVNPSAVGPRQPLAIERKPGDERARPERAPTVLAASDEECTPERQQRDLRRSHV